MTDALSEDFWTQLADDIRTGRVKVDITTIGPSLERLLPITRELAEGANGIQQALEKVGYKANEPKTGEFYKGKEERKE